MRKSVLRGLVACLLLAAALPAFSANLYVLIFANTEDEGIGCIHDVVNIGGFLRDVQNETGLELKAKVHMTLSKVAPDKLQAIKSWAQVLDGWSKADLDKELAALNPSKDDVVMFYYSGHGGRMSNKKGRWPDMAMQDKLVDLGYPMDVIAKKPTPPRLAISLGDCCNSFMDRSAEPKTRAAKKTAGLRPLFMDANGIVIASGSEPGQYSLGGSDGGVFTNAYFKAAYNPTNADWESVLRAAQQLTLKSSDGQQKAQFEFQGSQAATPSVAVAAAPAVSAPASSSGWGSAQAPAQAAPAASGWGSAQAQAAPASSGWGSAQAPAQAPSVPVSVSSTAADEYLAAIPIVKGKAAGSRKAGASPYPFTELTYASLEVKGKNLVVTMKLKSMPEELPFYAEEVPENELEYDWSAYIDADGDGNDDLMLSMMSFKFPDAEPEEGSPLDYCQTSLWELTEGGGSMMDIEVEASIEDNAIVLEIPYYANAFKLGQGATVSFASMYYLGGESFIP